MATSSEGLKIPFPAGLAARFRVRELLGRGGMGAVFRAEDRELGRPVAVKVMLEPGRPNAVARFLREARVTASIEHPHVIRIYDSGITDGLPWLAMELLDGSDFGTAPLGARPLARFLEIADALEAVHGRGLVHRDVKPPNMFLTRDGRSVLMDFGLAKDPDLTQLTGTGAMPGTFAFLSPEMVRDDPCGPAADWWALGVSLYTLLEKRLPYDPVQIASFVSGLEVPEVRLRRVPEGSPEARVIRGLLVGDPERRVGGKAALEALAGPVAEWTATATDLGDPVVPASPPVLASALPPRALPARSPVWLALPLLVAGGLVLAKLGARIVGSREGEGSGGRGGSVGQATGSAGSSTVRVRTPVAEIARKVAAELQEASRLVVDPEGMAREPPSEGLPEGWRELLSPDPIHWNGLLEHLSGVQDFLLWLQEGGRPESLDAATVEALREVDRQLVAQDLPEAFAPFLCEAPEALEVAVDPALLDDGFPVPTRGVRSLQGWAGAAWSSYLRALSHLDRLEAQREAYASDRDVGSGFPVEAFPSRALATSSLRILAQQAFGLPGPRIPVRIWMREGVLELRSMLYRIARALEVEGPETEVLGCMAVSMVKKLHPLWYSEAGVAPFHALTPGPGGSPWLAWLEAGIHGLGIRCHRLARLPVEPRQRAQLEAVERAMALGTGTGYRAFVFVSGSAERLETLRDLGRTEEALREFRAGIPTLLAAPPSLDESTAAVLCQGILAWIDHPGDHVPDRAGQERIRTWWRERRASIPRRSFYQERRAELAAWLGIAP